MNVNTLNGSTLAYMGDCVIELKIREFALKSGSGDSGELNSIVISMVNARAQSAAMKNIEDLLTEEEKDFFRRGRNSHVSIPKSASSEEYHRATGMEALFGMLYLTGQNERIDFLLDSAYGKNISGR